MATELLRSQTSLSLEAKVVGTQGRKGRGKEDSPLFFLLPSRARPQFLVLRARLLATEIEAPEKEAGNRDLYERYSGQ